MIRILQKRVVKRIKEVVRYEGQNRSINIMKKSIIWKQESKEEDTTEADDLGD